METRKNNIEILRILLTLMVITVHYNINSLTGGAISVVKGGSYGAEFILLSEALSIVCVNGFILITGYFSYNQKSISITKIGLLLFWVISYNWIDYLICILLGKQDFSIMVAMSKFVPNNWYVMVYIALLVILPYVNIVIDYLKKEKMIQLVFVLFLLFSVWNTLWGMLQVKVGIDIVGISTVGIMGDQAGYTIVNFVFLYLVGAILHKWNLLSYNKIYDLLGYLICTLIIYFGKKFGFSMYDYSNCFVIASSVFLFDLFRKIRLEIGRLEKCILFLSKACFGVYIIHTKAIIEDDFWKLCSVFDMSDGNIIATIVNYIVCLLSTFTMCVIIDSFYRFALYPLLKKVEAKKIFVNIK